jgi:hypothetical protein
MLKECRFCWSGCELFVVDHMLVELSVKGWFDENESKIYLLFRALTSKSFCRRSLRIFSSRAVGLTFRLMSFGSGQQGLMLYFMSDAIFAFVHIFRLSITFGEDCEMGWMKEISNLSLFNSAIELVLVIPFCLKLLILASMTFATVFIWGISWDLRAASIVFVWVFIHAFCLWAKSVIFWVKVWKMSKNVCLIYSKR